MSFKTRRHRSDVTRQRAQIKADRHLRTLSNPSLVRRGRALCRAEAPGVGGFTLIELLVVISIIVILVGLAFPAYQSVQNRAKGVQAKNDLTQLVTAVNAYYTEYGKYPLPAAQQGSGEDFTYSPDGSATQSNSDLIKILQASNSADNPRGIIFLSAGTAKSAGGYGIQPASASNAYLFLDPWKRPYSVRIDSDYNGRVTDRATTDLLALGVISWSLGKDGDWDKSGIASWK